MIRVAHIITDTDTGGAEMMLAKLVRQMDSTGFRNDILSLMPLESVGNSLRRDGFSVESTEMRPGRPTPASFLRLVKWLRARRPAVVQTWMYHSDLLGGLAAVYGARAPVLWNIRQSNLDPVLNTSSTMRSAGVCRRLSGRLPEVIVCGSEAARRTHTAFGYDSRRMEVIPNGFDTSLFRPDPEAGTRLRAELKIPQDALIIGLAGRLDPQKDHLTFIRAAKILLRGSAARQSARQTRPVYFVLCGKNIEWSNPQLREWIGEGPEGDYGRYFRLLGRRQNLHGLYPAFDISGTSSRGEGFPNVVGEAMSCGLPCVVTDVGDSAQIVGDTGYVVPPADPEALAAGWRKLLLMDEPSRRRLGERARERIERMYSMKAVAERYQQLYARVYHDFYGVNA